MLRFRSHLPASVLVLAAMLAACDGDLTQPRGAARASFTILDGARGGNAHFFFLPPMVPAPTYSGTFDGSQSPVVQICELTGSTCGATVASFSGSAVKVDLAKEAYVATWKTKGAALDPTKTYRINVQVGTTVLGYADVVVLANGSQIKTVDKNQFVATINGGVLNIRFRIETAPPPPPPGQWRSGDVITCSQFGWDDGCMPAADYLNYHFNNVYFSTGGVLEVGLAGTAGFSMVFGSADDVIRYLPTSGPVGTLNADLLNPTSSASGSFGVEVVALKLNVDLSDAGATGGASGIPFGNLVLCNVTAPFNGLSVRQFLSLLNEVLGGESGGWDVRELQFMAADLNASFSGGTVSAFAPQHLGINTCQAVQWSDGDVITYTPADWLRGYLRPHFDAVYFSVGGVLEVGLATSPGFSMVFGSASDVISYLPAFGPAGTLNADLFNPTSSASGIFGGEVVSLKLNIDFSDAGHIVGASGIRFGDLRLCNLATPSSLNGSTIRDFLLLTNAALGGGSVPYTATELSTLARQLNSSFEGGIVSQFAQDHLVNGACP